jgi:hypothetical protein
MQIIGKPLKFQQQKIPKHSQAIALYSMYSVTFFMLKVYQHTQLQTV